MPEETLEDKLTRLTKESLLLPVKKIADIEYIKPDFLIESMLIRDTVGFISASPGSTKTWLAWDMALSIATGTKCMGVFQSKKGRVLAFNAEDSPGAITKGRLTALASKRGINIDDVDNLMLIDKPTLMIDDTKTQELIKATTKHYKPDLIILDPFRQVHGQNEDKASDMAPVLAFMRELERVCRVTVLLVCHERKGSTNGEGRRADRTRGSNALEGWRDTAIYMDKPDKDKKTKVQVYHRGHLSPSDFYFELHVKNEKLDGEWQMIEAGLDYVSQEEVDGDKMVKVAKLVFEFIKLEGASSGNQVFKGIGGNRKEVFGAISEMLRREIIVKESKGVNGKMVVPVKLGSEVPDFSWYQFGTTPF